jgi:hypothetical protein
MANCINENKYRVLLDFYFYIQETKQISHAQITTYAAILEGFNPANSCTPARLYETINPQVERFLNWFRFVYDAEATLTNERDVSMKFLDDNVACFPLCYTDPALPMEKIVQDAKRLFSLLSKSVLQVSEVNFKILDDELIKENDGFTDALRFQKVSAIRAGAHLDQTTSLLIYHSVLCSVYERETSSDVLMDIAQRYFKLESQLSDTDRREKMKEIVDFFILGNPSTFAREAFALLCYCDRLPIACIYFLRSFVPSGLYLELERILSAASLQISPNPESTLERIYRSFFVPVTKDTYPNGLPSAFGSIATKNNILSLKIYGNETNEDVDTEGMQ